MTWRPLLIGFTGAAGAGKSTAAEFLVDQYAFTHIAMADPMVNMVAALFATAGISEAYMTERVLKEQPTMLGYSYRRLMQTLGTEWGRGLAPDFWLRVASLVIDGPELQGENVVISDIRFPNEADWLLRRGGVLVRVLRHELPQVHQHESEQHWRSLPATHEIHNTTSLATLHEQLDRLMEHLRS